MRNLHELQIKTAVEAVASRKEVNEVYFVACGGSQAVLMAGQYLFDKESSVPSLVHTENEFVYDTPKNLCGRAGGGGAGGGGGGGAGGGGGRNYNLFI